MTSKLIRRTTVACLGALASTAACAHLTSDASAHLHSADLTASFAQGLLHPLTGLDHLAAMVCVGLWSVLGATQPRSGYSLWRQPAAFALTMLLGTCLSRAGMSLPGVEPMIAASLLIFGLLIAARAHLSPTWGTTLVASFALFHGAAHGQELGGHMAATLGGLLMSTVGLHVAGIYLGQRIHEHQHVPASRWITRLAGMGVTTMGLAAMGPALAASL